MNFKMMYLLSNLKYAATVLLALFCCCYAAGEAKPGEITELKATYSKQKYKYDDVKLLPGEYSYKIWLPKSYNDLPDVYFPCFVVSNPGGNADMTKAKQYLIDHDWIVIMLVNARNSNSKDKHGRAGSPMMNGANFISAYDDASKKFRISKELSVLTGVSGGARASSLYSSIRPGFGAVIFQAAGVWGWDGKKYYNAYKNNPTTLWVGLFGNTDYNLYEADRLRTEFPKNRTYINIFKGGHTWAPEAIINDALDWIEAYIYLNKKVSKKSRAYVSHNLIKRLTVRSKELDSAEDILDYEYLKKAGKKQGVRYDKSITKTMDEKVRNLKKDKAISKQLKVLKMFQKLKDKDDPPTAKQKPMKVKDRISFWEKYKKKFRDEAIIEKIDQRIESLTAEYKAKK